MFGQLPLIYLWIIYPILLLGLCIYIPNIRIKIVSLCFLLLFFRTGEDIGHHEPHENFGIGPAGFAT